MSEAETNAVTPSEPPRVNVANPPKVSAWEGIGSLLSVLSGLLLARQPNSGLIVFIRALWITVLVMLLTLILKERLAEGATWYPALPHRETRNDPVSGAVFGGAHAALYSRFSSQWTYLAGLYNQIMTTAAQAPLVRSPSAYLRRGEPGLRRLAEQGQRPA